MLPRRGRGRVRNTGLTEHMYTVWFYLALVAAHPAGALRVVTFLRSLGGSSWTDCATVMSWVATRSVQTCFPFKIQKPSASDDALMC